MGIGLPLLQALTSSQFRAVIAHEFGHYAGGDLKLGGWIYKTRGAMGRTIKNLARTYKESGWGSSLYWFLGGDRPGKTGAYVATGAIAVACVLSFVKHRSLPGRHVTSKSSHTRPTGPRRTGASSSATPLPSRRCSIACCITPRPVAPRLR